MPTNQFLLITGKKYDDMRKRFGPRYDENNHLVRAGREIPFSKDEFRVWIQAEEEKGLRCAYCEARLALKGFEPDHNVPVKKRGGSLALSNLVVACRRCNVAKGDLTGDEFRALMKGLATFPEKARSYILQKLSQRPLFRPGKDFGAKTPRKTFSRPRPAPQTKTSAGPLFEERW